MQKKLETTTPGPWQVHASPTKALGYMITRAALGPGGGIHIGNVYSEDNARLIAAAPEMLTALRALVEECRYRATRDDTYGVFEPDEIPAIADALRAIAAATGDA